MAVDRVLFRRIEAGLSDPMVRIYEWEPACVTLGYSQKAEQELNFLALAERGFDWVKRPTGGRAVLHHQEFTYSILSRNDSAPWCNTRDLSYAQIGKALVTLLNAVGISAELARGEAAAVDKKKSIENNAAPACFASISRLEVSYAGKKLVGSAQRRGRTVFLQHGSMPLTTSHLDLIDLLAISPMQRAGYLEPVQHHALDVAQLTQGKIGYSQLALITSQAFSTGLGLPLLASGLTREEIDEVEQEWRDFPHGCDSHEIKSTARNPGSIRHNESARLQL